MQRRTDATNSSHTNTGYSSSSSSIQQQQQQQQQQLDHSKSGTSAGTRNNYTTGIKSTTLLDGDLRLSESSDDD
jgi:response regulator of citrate/malate metabolism